MDTKALRQKILDLAIHGKLVPQDPNDEPASVLLERIKAEKERLIKEGKIKRSKKSAKSSDTPHYENVPFELPNSWVWCRLEDIAYVASGSTPDKTCFVENGVPYIKMYNLRNQKIDFAYHPQYITEEVHNGKLQRSRTEVGDLIMNIVGPPLGKLAIIPTTLPQANFNQAAVLIRPYKFKEVLVSYLKIYLEEMSEINSIAVTETEMSDRKTSSEDVPDQEFEQSVTIEDIIGNQVHTFIGAKEFPKDPKQGFAPANLDNTEMVVTAEPNLKPPFTEVTDENYLDSFDVI